MTDHIKIEIKVSYPEESEITVDKAIEWTNLYVVRQERKLKQKDIAKVLNIHPVTYSRKERGELEFTLNEAFILADFFNISIERLFGYLRK